MRDLKAGTNTRLTNKGSWANDAGFASGASFSPDGKQIAYTWFTSTNYVRELRLITISDLKSRVLTRVTNCVIYSLDWSPDGKTVAALISQSQASNATDRLSLFSTADGVERQLIALKFNGGASLRQGGPSTTLRFSPDGRYLAYDGALNHSFERRVALTNDIFVVDVQSGNQKKVVTYLAGERLVDWAPQGRELLFSSERRGVAELWSITVENGGAKGEPTLLKTDFGEIETLGFTRSGAFFYSKNPTVLHQVYLASVDLESGVVLSPPKLVLTPEVGSTMKPQWSRSGKYLVFDSGKPARVHLLDMEIGQHRAFDTSREWTGDINWYWPTRDNKFLFFERFGKDKSGLFTMNTESGEVNTIALNSSGARFTALSAFHENSVTYLRRETSTNRLFLVHHDVTDGRERSIEISDPPENNAAIRFPDARSVVFQRHKSAEGVYVAVRQDFKTGQQIEFSRSKFPVTVVVPDDNLIGQRYRGAGVDPATVINFNRDEGLAGVVTRDERAQHTFTIFSFANGKPEETSILALPEKYELRLWPSVGSILILRELGDDGGEKHSRYWSMSTQTRELKPIGEFEDLFVSWPNLTHVFLAKHAEQKGEKLSEIWALSTTTGELKPTGISLSGILYVSLHPDGKRLFIRANSQVGGAVWVMENFLPAVAATK